MSLQKYWEKRNFSITSEPHGKVAKPGKKLSYFIQKHDASHLHYDFRLELEGTLKSWAVPKGPSLDPGDKRLAVHVEDHPLSYGTFEGVIPPRQYGAGTVLLWDFGIWSCDDDPVEGYRKGRLKFKLDGEKLSGGWTLVRMGPPKEKKENWLLIKERDEYAAEGNDANITELRPESVAGQVKKAAKGTAAKNDAKNSASNGKKYAAGGGPAAAQPHAALAAGVAVADVAGAKKTALPEVIAPQLATLTDKAPHGSDWLSEVKFDGYRAMCRVDNPKSGAARAAMFTRRGNDWTAQWKSIADAAAALPVKQAWFDGEVVAISEDGAISFQALQNIARHGAKGRLAYAIFDLVYLDGYDLSEVALHERKRLLKEVMSGLPTDSPLLYSDHIQGSPGDILKHACMHGMEGIIAKRADSLYRQSRTTSWLKIKCQQRQEFVVGGYTDPAGSREHFGALLVGVYGADNQFHYAGKVGTGFDGDMLAELGKKLVNLEIDKSPFVDPPAGFKAKSVHWMKPQMVVEIKFGEWTGSGAVRHASFVGVRADKAAREVRRENPVPIGEVESTGAAETASNETAPPLAKSKKKSSRLQGADGTEVAGISLSHPARILFTDIGLTKFKLAQYYEAVAEWILPHLRDRPLTLVRCPNGGEQKCFFQKHATEVTSDDIERVTVPSGEASYMMANSVQALISMVQMGVLELHTWGATSPRLDRPDRIIFDLDPAPDLGWPAVVEAAQLIKSLLEQIGLTSFVKTTGGKGLHVVAPIKPEKSWDEIKPFSRAIAEHLARTFPDRFTSKMTKATRTGKIFIDYLRNGVEATAVAAYSTRARPGAPISVPIAWEELDDGVRSDTFNVLNIGSRLQQLKEDPWEGYFKLKQKITEKMLHTFASG